MCGKRIPGLASGILFLLACSPRIAAASGLADELLDEGSGGAASVEARRAVLSRPGDLAAVAALERARAPLATPAGRRAAWSGWPVRWIVGMYRRHIGPAIGARCSLVPSCSQYFLEAGNRYGWLAVPLIGDRLVREPSVVQCGEHPVAGKTERYADPVEDHAWWHHHSNEAP